MEKEILFHILYFNHNFSSLNSSQILTNSMPFLFLIWKAKRKSTQDVFRRKKLQKYKWTPQKKNNKTHYDIKSEIIIYKENISKTKYFPT